MAFPDSAKSLAGPSGGKTERDDSGFAGLTQPGQRTIENINPLTEGQAIERKADLMAKSIFMIELALLVPWILAYLTLGYWVVLVVVEAFVVMFFLAWCKFLEWRTGQLGEEEYSINVPFSVCFIAIVLLAVFWNTLLDVAGHKYRLMAWAMGLTLYFIVPIIVSRLLLVYRMGGEVSEENPRKATTYPKWVWPWTDLGDIARWDAPLPPEPETQEQTAWVAQTVKGARGQGSWSFYTPPSGITYLQVWRACSAIKDNYDVKRRVYPWPGEGRIQSLGSKLHRKLQKDWIDKRYAVMLSNNNAVLLHKGIKVMEQVIAEPRPVRR